MAMVEVSELFELSKFNDFFILILTLVVVCTAPVCCVQGLKVFKIQNYDLAGTHYGSKASAMSLEATVWPVGASSPSPAALVRRCLLLRATQPSSAEQLQWAVEQGVGGVLLMLPVNITTLSSLQYESLQSVEQYLLSRSFEMPVLVSVESESALELYNEVEQTSTQLHTHSSYSMLMSLLSSTGHQLDLLADSSAARTPSSSSSQGPAGGRLHNLEGVLHGQGVADQLLTIVLVAHYDSTAAAPAVSVGADSNGSGVAILMELARLFGRLYRHSSSHGRVNVHFLLSSGGTLNYAGDRHWLDENADLVDLPTGQGVQFVVCLDSLASGNVVNFHVSKPPRANTPADKFYKILTSLSELNNSQVRVNMVHKKINLAEPVSAWQHEVFSMRRLAAFTLSRHQSADPSLRGTMLDTVDSVDLSSMTAVTRLLATALIQYIYQLDQHSAASTILSQHMDVSSDSLRMWMKLLTASPRPPQLLVNHKTEPIVSLSSHLRRELHSATVSSFSCSGKQLDWQLFDMADSLEQLQLLLRVQLVKSAAFDLFISAAVLMYLAVVFVGVTGVFPAVYSQIANSAVKRHTE